MFHVFFSLVTIIVAMAHREDMSTTVAVREGTRKLLEMLKSGDETYDDVIRMLLAAHPNQLSWAELNRRFRSEDFEPVEDMLTESRSRRARGL